MREIMKFGADWCPPCLEMEPVIESLQKIFPDYYFSSVDVDDQFELAYKYAVKTIPTFILCEDGVEIDRIHGFQTTHMMREKIEQAFA